MSEVRHFQAPCGLCTDELAAVAVDDLLLCTGCYLSWLSAPAGSGLVEVLQERHMLWSVPWAPVSEHLQPTLPTREEMN